MSQPQTDRDAIKRVAHAVIRADGGESIARAIDNDVDMVEVDVVGPPWSSGFFVAHDSEELAYEASFDEALAKIADSLPSHIELNVDIKVPGYERGVVERLREHGLLERSLISSHYQESLTVVRELDPDVRRGLSVPKVKRDLRDHRVLKYPAYAAVAWWRSGLPAKAERALRRGHCEALMSHYVLVTRHLVKRIHAAGGQLYVWTVDDAAQIARLEALGVDAVITNDPRLFR